MNEQQARTVLLAKAIESAPQRATWASGALQRAASEAALAAAPRPASDARSREWAERFLHLRAQWLLDQVSQQHPGVHWLRGSAASWGWLGTAWPLLALVAGWLGENLFSPGHIHLLSPALVAVLAWNWGLMLWLLLRRLQSLRHWGRPPALRPEPHAPRRWPHLPWPDAWGKALWGVSQGLQRDWRRVAGPCLRVRWLSRLHDGAAWLALGLIASLAWKGLYGQYRVGWESAWIDAPLMHQLVNGLASLVGSAPFSANTINSLQGWSTASAPEVGTAWFWLVAKLLLLTVVLPRWLLARLAAWRARRLSQHLRLDLTEPYYVALLASFGGHPTPLQVWPYSYTLDAAQQSRLAAAAQALHGAAATVALMPHTPYGQLPPASHATPAPGHPTADQPHPVALFSLAATPEAEAHGQFVQHLAHHHRGTLALWVDRSALARKLGASPRLAEREALWRAFAAQHGVDMHLIDLDA